jgi:hypothetical protein
LTLDYRIFVLYNISINLVCQCNWHETSIRRTPLSFRGVPDDKERIAHGRPITDRRAGC